MLKSRLIFSFIIMMFLLVIIFSGKNFISWNGVANLNADTQKKAIEKGKYSLNQLRYTEMEKKTVRSKYTSEEFQAGMNVLIYGHPNMMEVKRSFLHLRELGFNSVAINFPFYQKNWRANEVSVSQENTPTIAELKQVIEEAHYSGLSVTLRPIMDEQSFESVNKWRGQIKPTDPDTWFDSYQAFILTYAELAQDTNVKIVNIGTELNSLQNKYDDRWVELIENVRHVYDGELMYSFNWDVVDEVPTNKFVTLLDHVGIDAYFPLNIPNGATVEMLEKAWTKKVTKLKDELDHSSIIVTEAGIIPVAGAYRTPYSWHIPHEKLDWEAQANYYEATFNVWKPVTKGIYWWNITIDQDPEEMSYSPLYSPTEEVIKKQLQWDFSNR